jgi:hypothetical protein|nr:MAG TPA: hypothetical protein [Caudoviricetes sp.]
MRLLRSLVVDNTVNVDQIISIYIQDGIRIEGKDVLLDNSSSVLSCDLTDSEAVYLACSDPDTIRFYRDRLEKALVDLNGDKIIDIDDLI